MEKYVMKKEKRPSRFTRRGNGSKAGERFPCRNLDLFPRSRYNKAKHKQAGGDFAPHGSAILYKK